MTFFLSISKYLLPLIMLFIVVKCLISLLFGRPRQNIIAHMQNSATGEQLKLQMWETSIGRSRANDIPLDYPTVSKFHAVVARRVNGWYVYDINSKNGVQINGEAINHKGEIENGDTISFGESVNYKFIVDNDPIIKPSRRKIKRMQKEAELRRRSGVSYTAPSNAKNQQSYESTYNQQQFTQSTQPAFNSNYYPPEQIQTQLSPALISPDGHIIRLNDPRIFIGSGDDCAVRLISPNAELVQAFIELYEDGSFVINNLSFSGTTYLNGVRVFEPQILIEGDRLTFADETYTYTERA